MNGPSRTRSVSNQRLKKLCAGQTIKARPGLLADPFPRNDSCSVSNPVATGVLAVPVLLSRLLVLAVQVPQEWTHNTVR